jgi:DNA segregation ATPase FtsK/SpoIIIE-like protein
LRIGYTRASRIVDMMEDKKIVGPPEGGTQMRQVLDYGDVRRRPPSADELTKRVTKVMPVSLFF